MRFAGVLDDLRDSGLYRRLRPGRIDGAHITVGGRRLLNLCSNDYLGLPPDRVARGQFQSSSRLLSGSDASHGRLEDALARHKSQERALVFPTGYMANIGAIQAVAEAGDTILSDSLNHASIIQGCRLSGATVSIYGHNDVDDLEQKLVGGGRRFVITEGIFSMDGDCADLARIADVAHRAGAMLILDDAHGDFAVGPDGSGTAGRLGLAGRIDMYVSSLSKALGSFGGYVAARKETIDLLVNRSKAFIYTSALPSGLADHALRRVRSDRAQRQERLAENARLLAAGLRAAGYDVRSGTHIIPVMIHDEKRSEAFAMSLADLGVFAQPVRYPTVPRGGARIRLSVTAWLERDHIGQILDAFGRAGREHGVL